MAGTAGDALGALLAHTPSTAGTISAQVIDATDSGGVNLMVRGALVLDVRCADSYTRRTAGDWVAVQLQGGRPVVMWRLGDDPASADATRTADLATAAALDVQTVRAATWGTTAPTGTGWQQVALPWVRRSAGGRAELYLQLVAQTSPSPTAPPEPPPSPVTVLPSDAGTWRDYRRDMRIMNPQQGNSAKGGWFYGTAVADAAAGRTVAGMTVALTRVRGIGTPGARPVHMYLHDYTAAPAGDLVLGDGPAEVMSLSAGGVRTAALPPEWCTALAAGAARGLAITAIGPDDLMAMTGAALTITYS